MVHRGDCLEVRLTFERPSAREHLVQNRTEGENITAGAGRSAV